MKFRFNINLTDDDYLAFNKFYMLKSKYGKKTTLVCRIITAVMGFIGFLAFFTENGRTLAAFISALFILIVFAIFELCFNRIYSFIIKLQIKSLNKVGKAGYTPISVLEFYDDYIAELTADKRTEEKYSSIERISVVTENKIIYIHTNNIAAYLLPFAVFESPEQYNEFFDFIKTKCSVIDIY